MGAALLYAAVQEVEAGSGDPCCLSGAGRMRQQRKHMLQEKVRLSGRARASAPGMAPAHQPCAPAAAPQVLATRRW